MKRFVWGCCYCRYDHRVGVCLRRSAACREIVTPRAALPHFFAAKIAAIVLLLLFAGVPWLPSV